MPEFPAMMYKIGTAFQWDGDWVDTLIVAKEAEYNEALAEGWSIGKPSAEPVAQNVAEQPKRRERKPKAAV
jgi:hypothetical protein